MYDIRQFKPLLYLLVLLGISTYAYAAESPGVWALAFLAIGLNALLVAMDRFTPMPRWLSSIITIGSLLYVTTQVLHAGNRAILVVGQYLVFLQIIKFYEQRANRDYGQLLVLSLLMVIAASINTASLIFALLLTVYLFLSLYCCLLFHLKVESDGAKLAQSLPATRLSAAGMRQNQMKLSSSMRRLTALVAGASITVAVVVFIFFPRGAGSGMLGQFSIAAPMNVTGLSDSMELNTGQRIEQNSAVVAYVQLFQGSAETEGLIETGRPIYLRSTSFDRYDRRINSWFWRESQDHVVRSHNLQPNLETPVTATARRLGKSSQPSAAMPLLGENRIRQVVDLAATGSTRLIALPGVYSIKSQREVVVRYFPLDDTIQLQKILAEPLHYELICSGQNNSSTDVVANPVAGVFDALQVASGLKKNLASSVAVTAAAVDPRIHDYAMTVVGKRAERRHAGAIIDPVDPELAQAIEQHLRSKFQYTTDLTDVPAIAPGDNPIVPFLYEFKRGHCSFFAAAMCLMCQSLGMQARVVNGYLCDEYSSMGQHYIVRQSQAHAWVEVLTNKGWQTFDPTSSTSTTGGSSTGMWQSVRHFFGFLEYKWASSVIAYNNEHRENIVSELDKRLTDSAYKGSQVLGNARGTWQQLRSWLDSAQVLSMPAWALFGLVALLMPALAIALTAFIIGRWRVRRSARRMGLAALPAADRLRMARQLGFYSQMMQMLERHQMKKTPAQTPQEFSESLSHLRPEAFETVVRLTRIFYRIRYGRHEVGPAQHRHIRAALNRLSSVLP